MTDQTDTILRHPDGSLDTAAYIARAHVARSRAAREVLSRLGRTLPRLHMALALRRRFRQTRARSADLTRRDMIVS